MADLHLLSQATRLLSGTLSAFLLAAATSMTVSTPPATSRLPTLIEIEPDSSSNKETVRVTNVVGNVCTIERGVYTGGVGVDHQSNSTYKEKITQKHWDGVVVALEDGWLTEDSIYALTQVDSDTFTIAGIDRTGYASAGRILRLNSTTIVTVVSSTYGGGNTTVNVKETAVPTPITKLEYAIGPKGASNKFALATDITDVKSDVQKNAYRYAADAGASDAYAITLSPVPAAYTTGMVILFKANTKNTGPCTLNVNSLGAKNIKLPDGNNPPNDYIVAGALVQVAYNGTDFILLSVTGTEGYVDLTDGATIDIDMSLGSKFRIRDMAGNRTLTLSNPIIGKFIELQIWQDSVGSRLISEWFTGNTTFATTDVDITTDIITVGRDIPTGTPIKFTSTDGVPAGLAAGTKYYAIRQSATTIKVATSLANAQAGTAIDLTSQGTGTHTIRALIRWKDDTEPTLSTGKYKIDSYVFQCILNKVFTGVEANKGM